MKRELFVVEKLRAGHWVPQPTLVGRASTEILNRDGMELTGRRIAKYVPEDPTPRLLAAWQSIHGGKVGWKTEDDRIVCVLSADTRRAAGEAEPLDPFGAARVALASWASAWGGTYE